MVEVRATAITTMDEPLFSVIIPTHRRPGLLAEALASVAKQTHSGSQVIVVDDAGDPETAAVVARFRGVEYALNGNKRGGSGARNAGIALARGRWIAFLDDDDLWLPHKLERVSDLIANGADDLGLVYSAIEHFDADPNVVTLRTRPRFRGRVLDEVLYRNVIGGMSVAVVRRDLLERIGGFDERFPAMQDMEMFVRMAQVSSFDFVDDALVRFRTTTHTRITNNFRKKLTGAKLFAEKYSHLLRRHPRLRHRTAARTLVFAFAARDYGTLVANLPWTLAGLIVDPRNMSFVVRGLVATAAPVTVGRPHKAEALS